ncbi:MAG: hypothetical protein FD183_1790 [Chitinophagaceae bacterium]|nr:MAG: hypothetical protein FD183_1790 [Chitinophagaceae bacterium]
MSIPPSTWIVPAPPPVPVKVEFTFAFPSITIPAQSPERGTGELEVNTIGLSCAPSATIFAPLVIIKPATFAPWKSPLTVTPGSIFMVALFTI